MSQTTLIKNVLLDGNTTNILIEGNRFKHLHANANTHADKVIDGTDMAILPPFYNLHTHAAMDILRGYADDMPLFTWLTEHIWPFEAKLKPEDIYWGTKLAILEMIKSGTVFFNDMYFEIDQTIRAVEEMGMRAAIGVTMMENHPLATREEKMALLRNWKGSDSQRVVLTTAPHAIYTCGEELLRDCAQLAAETDTRLHIHISETEQEVKDCLKAHGTTPVRYLDKIGLLGSNVVAAHVVHVDKEEIQILKRRGVTVVHNPCSNMKLASGIFHYADMMAEGLSVALGTDGSSSNNNLDMREEMKMAAMLAKVSTGNPTCLSAQETFEWATVNGARAFGIDAGVIAEGKLADALLIDLNNERMTPNYNLTSNWVYAADSSCIDTVICDGRILMQHRHVEGEETIIKEIRNRYK